MSAHGVYAMSVIVSVVAENTFEVVSIEDLPDEIIKDQIDCIYNDMGTDAVKIGMLSNKRIMLSLIHISEPTRLRQLSRMPSSA